MKLRSAIGLTLIVMLLGCASTSQSSTEHPSAWKPLFNGNDLTGWYTFLKGIGKDSDPKHVFQVSDGVIHIYKDAEEASQQPFGYIATNDEFGDCRIRFEYKWGTKRFGSRATAKRDSGFLYHFIGEDGGFGKGPWPYSVECQVQEGDVGDIYAIGTQCSSTIDPAKRDAKQPTFMEATAGGIPYTSPPTGNNRIIRSQMLEKDAWNAVEVILQGDSAVHIVNGKVNMRISRIKGPKMPEKTEMETLKRGKILFQAEGAEVMYRKVEVQVLSK
jgi:hypothetical protein